MPAKSHTTHLRGLMALVAIAAGVVTCAGGATLGVAAVTDGDPNAADIAYTPTVVNPPLTNAGGVLGESGQGENLEGSNGGNGGPQGEVEGESGGGRAEDGEDGDGTVGAVRELQPTRQLASVDARTLPFTGYLAIPALAVGAMLIATGLVLRRRQRRRRFT